MTLKVNPVLASPLGKEGHEVAKGVQANWIHRGAPRPANPVRRHPAKSVWTVVRMIMTLDMDVTAERRHYNTYRPRGRYHNPQRRRRCCPLSEAMHSEHDLKERQRRTNHSESFPLWGATLLYNPRRQPRPFFYNLRRSRHHNPRPEGPSNLRTLGPKAHPS